MWEPRGSLLDRKALGSLEPEEILFEFEGEPLTFTASDQDGELLLVHNLSVFDRTSRYLVSPIDDRTLGELKAGRIDIRTGLRQSRCWVADILADATVGSIWLVKFDSLPEEVLPRSGAMLTPELEPLLRVRLVGSGVGAGKTSASDIRMAAQAAESSMRGLARIALAVKKRSGRPTRDVRYYANPPYQYSKVASFEIAFGRPQESRLLAQDGEVFDEMAALLASGLASLRSEDRTFSGHEDLGEEEKYQLLEAIKALTPPTRGGVDRIEVGGSLVERMARPPVLTRDDRRRVVERLKTSRKVSRKEAPFRISGVIEAADQGHLTFILRDLSPRELPGVGPVEEIRFWFEDHFYDDVMDAFTTLERVVVVGERIGSAYQALDIQEAADVAPEDLEIAGPVSE